MGHYFKEDEPMVTCQEIYTQTDSVPISVELTERCCTLLGHILRLDPETPANKAMVQYFRKLRGIAQDNTKWADLVNHITNMMRVSWVRSNCTRKQQEVPWSSTPIIRVRPADARIPRRAVLPRLLAFDETSSEDI